MSDPDREVRLPDEPGRTADEPEAAHTQKLIAIGLTAAMGAVVIGALMFGRTDRAPDPSASLFEGPPAAETVGEAAPPEVRDPGGEPDTAPR